jgi:hypothetical protein
MDQHDFADAALATDAIDQPTIETASAPYLGRWNHLVSTTNWEKGRIICEWREALLSAGASAPSVTDEAWSRRVGNLTPQHCGRLRRVWQKFGNVRDLYPGLYWSHFQAVLDWPDAEMWLEGAVQNAWSIAQMAQQRSTTLGALEGLPGGEDLAVGEMDEDAPVDPNQPPEAICSSPGEVHEAAETDSDRADAARQDAGDDALLDASDSCAEGSVAEPFRPFAALPPLPDDLSDAVEAFKLAIVRHRQAGWEEISCQQVLAVLDALGQFASQPAVL